LTEVLSEDYLTEVGRETGFCKRDSKVTPLMFIDILIFNACADANKSLNQLSIETLSQHEVVISKQGIDKRFNDQAIDFVKTVFEKYLAKQVHNESLEAGWLSHFKHVRIKDGTRFDLPEEFKLQLPGSGGSASEAGICIQFEFDVKSGKILDLNLTPANRPDLKDATETIGNIEQGDLSIRDLGYFVLESFSKMIDTGAYLISRLNAKTKVYEEKDGKLKELNFDAIYRLMKNKGILQIERNVLIGKTAQVPVRLIIELMPDAVFGQRMKKINKGNKKKGYHTSKEYAQRARFNLFITNIPSDMVPKEAISVLYKIRWQIELVFKVWKSIFGIDNTRKMKYSRWLCLLYAKLLLIIINWEIIMVYRGIIYNKYGKMLSIDKCFKTLKDKSDKFRKAIREGWQEIIQLFNWIERMFINNHWLERKNKKTGFEKILYTSYCKSGIYVYI
jgi:hypothetical protein